MIRGREEVGGRKGGRGGREGEEGGRAGVARKVAVARLQENRG